MAAMMVSVANFRVETPQALYRLGAVGNQGCRFVIFSIRPPEMILSTALLDFPFGQSPQLPGKEFNPLQEAV